MEKYALNTSIVFILLFSSITQFVKFGTVDGSVSIFADEQLYTLTLSQCYNDKSNSNCQIADTSRVWLKKNNKMVALPLGLVINSQHMTVFSLDK